jgi:hypothetical protein
MVSMYRELKRLGQPARLHYWARDADAFLFAGELRHVEDVRLIVAAGKPEPGEGRWDQATPFSMHPSPRVSTSTSCLLNEGLLSLSFNP